jgi:hypothetical protein
MVFVRKSSAAYASLFVVILAFLVRSWGIWNVSTTDEYNEIIEALRVCSGHLNYDRWIKRFYLYILAPEFGIYFVIGWFGGLFQSPIDFAEKIARNLDPLFLIARATSVVAGTATVALTYKVGEKFFSRGAGLVAALLLALTTYHIDLSQQAKVDALLGLLVVMAFYFMLRLVDVSRRHRWDYAWCGLIIALAIQTKINSAVLLASFGVAAFFAYRSGQKQLLRPAGLFSGAFFVGLLIGNPAVAIAPLRFLENVYNAKKVFVSPVNTVPSDVVGFLAYPAFYLQAMGWAVVAVTAFALLYAAKRAEAKHLVCLVFVFAFMLLMGPLTSLVAPYYLIPITPIVYLLVGDAVTALLTNGADPNSKVTRKAVVAILLLALITPVFKVANHVRSVSGPNTRVLAKNWIERNIAPNAKILMDSGKSINSSAPLIAENRRNLEETIARSRGNIAQGNIVHEMVDQNAIIYYELLLKTVPSTSYDITSTMFGLSVKDVDYYVQNRFEYFVISGSMKEARTGAFGRENMPQIAAFYQGLDSDPRLELIQTIGSGPTNRGDTYYIYRLRG